MKELLEELQEECLDGFLKESAEESMLEFLEQCPKESLIHFLTDFWWNSQRIAAEIFEGIPSGNSVSNTWKNF